MDNRASLLAEQGKNEEAGRIYEEVVMMRRRTLGADHVDTLSSMCDLALAGSRDADPNDECGLRRSQSR